MSDPAAIGEPLETEQEYEDRLLALADLVDDGASDHDLPDDERATDPFGAGAARS